MLTVLAAMFHGALQQGRDHMVCSFVELERSQTCKLEAGAYALGALLCALQQGAKGSTQYNPYRHSKSTCAAAMRLPCLAVLAQCMCERSRPSKQPREAGSSRGLPPPDTKVPTCSRARGREKQQATSPPDGSRGLALRHKSAHGCGAAQVPQEHGAALVACRKQQETVRSVGNN